MSCLTLTSGICRGCRDNAGGIKTVYMANLQDVTAFLNAKLYSPEEDPDDPGTYIWDDGSPVDQFGREISSIDDITLAASANWYELQPNKYSSSFTETINSSIENGTIFYAQVLSLVFGKMQTAVRDVVEELGQSELVVVVETSNGKYFVLGQSKNGMVVSGGSGATGTAYGDLNGYTIELTCNSTRPAVEMNTVVAPTGDTTQDAEPVIGGNTLYQTLMAVHC